MGLELLPQALRNKYHIEERRHACAILDVTTRTSSRILSIA